jgi:hypothetical protein
VDDLLTALTDRIQRFSETGDPSLVLDPAVLDEANLLADAVPSGEESSQSISVDALIVLGSLHLARYEVLPVGEDQDDLQRALQFFGLLLERAPERVPENIRSFLSIRKQEPSNDMERLAAEGVAAFGEFQRTGRPEMLDAAVVAFERAVAATPFEESRRRAYLSNWAAALGTRFELAGNSADLDAAIESARQAAQLTPPGDPDGAMCLSNLGTSLRIRFDRSGDDADLEAAIDAGRRAVDTAPPGAADLGMYLANLGNTLLSKFERTGDGADLRAAIDTSRQAVTATPVGHPRLGGYLSDLATCLRKRFDYAGDSADLDEAVEVVRRAVELTQPGHPRRASRLANLGSTLRTRFNHAWKSADLDGAIDAQRQALDLPSINYRDRSKCLASLGLSLRTRFEWTGDGVDLDAAINAGRQAVDLTPPGDPNRAEHLSMLGNSLNRRFDLAGDAADVDEAINVAQQAVDRTPHGNPDRPGRLTNLGAIRSARFDLRGQMADLDAAVDAGRQAVDLTPSGHRDSAAYLSNLGISLHKRFTVTQDAGDLNAAIDSGQRAVAAAPPGHPSLGMYFSSLGNSLLARFELVGHEVDLDAAIDAERQAVALIPPGHPNVAVCLHSLARSLWFRFQRNRGGADLENALDCWRSASQQPTATPHVRLTAATSWGRAAAGADRIKEATEGFAAAVQLLPTVAWHGLDRATRANQLQQWTGLAADAAACAALDGRPELAVELLEEGRSVLWTQALNMRNDLTRLAERAPELAERLDHIRRTLDSAIPDTTLSPAEEADGDSRATRAGRSSQADLRRRKAREWDEVLSEIRALDEFEHFLGATPYAELAAALTDGPVVIVNASQNGCHAFIVGVGSDLADVVSLSGMRFEAALEYGRIMLEALVRAADPNRAFQDREKDRRSMLDVLEWLWDMVTAPVLSALGHDKKPPQDSRWPRIWWCPTGFLTVFPMHSTFAV